MLPNREKCQSTKVATCTLEFGVQNLINSAYCVLCLGCEIGICIGCPKRCKEKPDELKIDKSNWAWGRHWFQWYH